MTKKEKFLMLVQTGVIVKDIHVGRNVSMSVLAYAMEIPEKSIPQDTESAAQQYIDYQYQTSPPDPEIPRPKWLPE